MKGQDGLAFLTAAAEEANFVTRPGSGAVGGPGVDGDAHKRRIESVRGLPVGQPGHGGNPRHPSNNLGTGGHIVALPRSLAPGSDPGDPSLVPRTDPSHTLAEGKDSPNSGKVAAQEKHSGLCGSSDLYVLLFRLWVGPPDSVLQAERDASG